MLFKIAVDKKGKQKGFAAASVPIGLLEDFLGYNGRLVSKLGKLSLQILQSPD